MRKWVFMHPVTLTIVGIVLICVGIMVLAAGCGEPR